MMDTEVDTFNDQEKELVKFLADSGLHYYVSMFWPDGHWVMDELFPAVYKAHSEQCKYIILVWEDFEACYFTHGCKNLQEVKDALVGYREADMIKAEMIITYRRARAESDIEFDEDEYDVDDNLIMPSWAA